MLSVEQGKKRGRCFFLVDKPTQAEVDELCRSCPQPNRAKVERSQGAWRVWIFWGD